VHNMIDAFKGSFKYKPPPPPPAST
jgi:hypothetical protein